jgi:hypothetical protein
MPDRHWPHSPVTPATPRRITTLALTRTCQYGLRAIAASGLVADAPVERVQHRPGIVK